jgi:hypothetical protein
LTNCVIKKYGPANAVHNGNNISPAPIRVYEGAWVLGKSNSVSASKRFELHGGSLALADNVMQSLDLIPLVEGVSCGVTLGEEAVLELGTIDFGEGTKLAITGPEVRDGAVTKLRIGTSACLDNVVLSKMRYNTKRVKQNEDGWIKTSANALVISIR